MIFGKRREINFKYFERHVQMVKKPTHISGSLLDHAYIKKA